MHQMPKPKKLERRDAGLSNEEVESLWERDPQRAFIEWTFRMNDIPALLDGDVEFAERITAKLTSNLLVNQNVRYNMPVMAASFRAGQIGRAVWQIRARNLLMDNYGHTVIPSKLPPGELEFRRGAFLTHIQETLLDQADSKKKR